MKLLRALGITLLAFLLSIILASPLSFSITSIFSSPEAEDTQISDFYSQVANLRPVRSIDTDIVLIDIGAGGREEITELARILALCEPRAVGLDVMFGDKREGDSLLIDALKEVPNLVMPVGVDRTGGTELSHPKDHSYFFGTFPHLSGVVNLPAKFKNGKIREFATFFPMEGGDTLPSFPVAIAMAASPESAEGLKARKKKHEFIDYPSREFTVIPIEEAEENIEILTGKIIIIGSYMDAVDIHATPIGRYLPGVVIHAYSVSTILGNRYYSTPGILTDWILAFILCFFTVWISIWIDQRVKGLIVRIIQLLFVYLAVQIGYYLFVDHRIIFNFTYTLLMLTFGLLASDLWHGTVGLCKVIGEKRSRHRG